MPKRTLDRRESLIVVQSNDVPSLIVSSASDDLKRAFSICTLVTDWSQYETMKASFAARGFTAEDCEFMLIDNSGGNAVDAYSGLNAMLARARGERVILCHQDVVLDHDDRRVLEQRLEELSRLDPRWAVAGNAGGTESGDLAIRISDKHGQDQCVGTLPARVCSVDENFIVIDSAKRIAFSGDLSGFHFYGADICLTADMLGYSCYVIDFHLTHLGSGTKGQPFDDCRDQFVSKWRHALRDRTIATTCDRVVLASARSSLLRRGASNAMSKLVRRWKRSWRKRVRS